MTRIRTNFEYGVITDNPLTSTATTSNSTQYAALPVVTAPNILAITLDPKAVIGTPEIVYVTAHAANATSVTITRGQEGTTARSHSLNEVWVHALTAFDLSNTELPTTSNVGDAAAIGAGPAFALGDHLHGREGFSPSNPTSLGLAAGGTGTSTNPAHHDHQHPAPSVTPSSSLASDTAVVGSNGIATGDHKHGREGYGTSVSVSTASDVLNPGTQTTVSRSDHQHGREGYGSAASVSAVGDAQAPGSANTLSRSDHKHGRESFGTAITNVTASTSAAGGSASTPARSDHVHGRPTPTFTIGTMDTTSPSYGPSDTFATISGYGPPVAAFTTSSSGAVSIWAEAVLQIVASAWGATGDAYLAVGWGAAGLSGPWSGGFAGSSDTSGSNWKQIAAGAMDGDGSTSFLRNYTGYTTIYGLLPNHTYSFYLLWASIGAAVKCPAARDGVRNGTFIRVEQIT